MRRGAGLVVALGAVLVLALPAAGARAHGDEEEAMAEIPARTLVQQALALLAQQDNAAEAEERLDAALESEHQEGIEIASVRDALDALEADDHEEAAEHLNEALAPGEAAPGESEPVPGALEHADEFEPGRGSAEWIGFAVGVALIALAALGLVAARRARA